VRQVTRCPANRVAFRISQFPSSSHPFRSTLRIESRGAASSRSNKDRDLPAAHAWKAVRVSIIDDRVQFGVSDILALNGEHTQTFHTPRVTTSAIIDSVAGCRSGVYDRRELSFLLLLFFSPFLRADARTASDRECRREHG